MSKLSFRARALDPSKPMPIFLAEELPDLPEYSAINRAVPQMPSGMEKEEESEHHLQRAICTGLIIPTPEVYDSTDSEFYDKYYPPDYKLPKQLIHMQPLNLEQDIPDYDMDSSDEVWVSSHEKKLDLDPLKFEIMMDRLEKSSGQTVVTLNEAKALLKQDDEVSIAVYDYWLNKRLKMQHPLILYVKTENRGNMTPNNPYLAFRRRTEKMQTRKNRKNDESSYEKMLKLRRDLSRAVTLLDMIKRREKLKREQLHLSIEIYEKRYQAQDFQGHLLSEFTSSATRVTRPAFAPIYSNQYTPLSGGQGVSAVGGGGAGSGTGSYLASGGTSSQYGAGGGSGTNKRDNESLSSRKEKRQYKKRKLKMQKDRGSSAASGSGAMGLGGRGDLAGVSATSGGSSGSHHHHSHHHHHQHHHHQQQQQLHHGGTMLGGIGGHGMDDHHHHLHGTGDHVVSSDDEELANLQGTSGEEEYAYAFRRSKHSQYHRPRADGYGNWPWTSREENGHADPRYRFTLTSLRYPRPRCIGFARRRLGRGGRVIIDRVATDFDDLWSRLDYTIVESDTIASLASSETVKSRIDPHASVVEDVVIDRPGPIGRTVSVSSNCSNSSAGVVVSLKHPRLPALTNHLQHHRGLLVNGSDDVASEMATNGSVPRRKLILKQELPTLREYDDSDGGGGGEIQFLASIGLMNKAEKGSLVDGSDTLFATKRRLRFDSEEGEEPNLIPVPAAEQESDRLGKMEELPKSAIGGDTRAHGDVHNSDLIVIKSEDGAVVKQEPVLEPADVDKRRSHVNATAPVQVGEDFEQLIDSVNSRNSVLNHSNVTVACHTGNSISSTSTNAIDSTAIRYGGDSRTVSEPFRDHNGAGNSPSRLHDATREDIDAVYKDLLNDIQSNWLHFRPKTPEPSQDELLTLDGDDEGVDGLLEHCLGLTDANRISLELQTLGDALPSSIFATARSPPSISSSVFRTTPYALDNLIEPHPLSLEREGTVAVSSSSAVDIKLETSGSSSGGDNNNQSATASEINISLNESNEENEKMLDNILQECATDDPGSLHQTSNFWNGILDDGASDSAEPPPEGEGEKEQQLAQPVNHDPYRFLIGYHSELVGYGRPTGLTDRRTINSKRRKMLKRCSYLVGSSCFSVRSMPKEEIFQPLLDADGQPICMVDGDLDIVPSEGIESNDELREGDESICADPGEIKMESEGPCLGTTDGLREGPVVAAASGEHVIKVEPPDELLTPADGGGCDTPLLAGTPATVQFLTHGSTSLSGSVNSATAGTTTTIKLEPFNHISQIAARSSTPTDGARVVPTGSATLIPATIGTSAMFPTSSGTVPSVVSVSLQQGGLHQLVHTSSAPSMAPGTTMLVMQSIPSNGGGSVSSSSSVSGTGAPTSFLLSTTGGSAGGGTGLGTASSIAGSILVQSASAVSHNAMQSAGSSPIVVTVPPASSAASIVMPSSATNTVVSLATPIVVSASSAHNSLTQSIVANNVAGTASSSGVTTASNTATGLNSYIVQHNSTPIMLSHQQMQQLTVGGGVGGNIVTVGGQQVVTAKQHHGETFVLTQTPLKKQINGPSDGGKNTTAGTVTTQNINNHKFHALLSQKLGSAGKSDLNKKQLEMIRKALVSTPKVIVKSSNHPLQQQQQQQLHVAGGSGGVSLAGHHQQSASQAQQQQQPQYNVIHPNSLNSPITIVSAQSPGQPTQNKIILTSSPHLLQQATAAVGGASQLIAAATSSHGKIQLTTVQQGQQQQQPGQAGQITAGTTAGGQIVTIDPSGQQGTVGVGGVQQQLKLDKNRILYNFKNSRGQFLHLNPKVVNIIQPIQQQKIVNNLTIQQQQQQQQLLHNQAAHGGTTTILNNKGQAVQRIPTVSIRTQQQAQQQQQQLQQQQTNLVDMVVVNNTNNIKFIQAAASAAAAAAAAGGGNVVNNAGSTVVPSRVNSITPSGDTVGSSSSGTTNCSQVVTTVSTALNASGGTSTNNASSSNSSSSSSSAVTIVTNASSTTGATVVTVPGGTVSTTVVGGNVSAANGAGGGNSSSNGSAGTGAPSASTNSSASINITNR